MKKILVLLALLSTHVFAWEQRAPNPVQACQVHSPYGWATTASAFNSTCRAALTNGYGDTNTNVWSPIRYDHIFIGVKN